MIIARICQASGGPCTYTGREMNSTPPRHDREPQYFNALVGVLVTSLHKFNVPSRTGGPAFSLGPPASRGC